MGGRQPRPRSVSRTTGGDPYPGHARRPWWLEGRERVSTHDLGVEIGDPWPIISEPKDLQPFTGYEPCPRCGRWDLHWLERANPAPPTVSLVTPQIREVEASVMVWGHQTYRNVHRWDWADPEHDREPDRWLYRLSRADERGFDVIRRCRSTDCQHRWPEGRATVNAVRQHQPKE